MCLCYGRTIVSRYRVCSVVESRLGLKEALGHLKRSDKAEVAGRGGQFYPIGIAEIQSRVAETQIGVLRALRGDWVDKLGSYYDSLLFRSDGQVVKSQVVRMIGL